MLQKIFKFILRRKITFIVVVVLLAVGGYYWYASTKSKQTETRYVLAAVQKGTLVATVSGSGQVSTSNQVDVKSKVSGTITSVLVKKGQRVKAGDILVRLDSKDASKAVRDAEISLENAKLALEKLKKPATDYSIMLAENAVDSAKNNLEKLKLSQKIEYERAKNEKQKAEDSIVKAYEDVYNTVSDAFLDLPDVMTGLYDTFFCNEIGKKEITVKSDQPNDSLLVNHTFIYTHEADRSFFANLVEDIKEDYNSTKISYDANLDFYKALNRSSAKSEETEDLLEQTIETCKEISDLIKEEINALDFWVEYRKNHDLDVFDTVTQYQLNLNNFTTTVNKHLSNLLSVQRTLEDNKEAALNAEQDLEEMELTHPLDLAAAETAVKEKIAALEELKTEPDPLDIRSQELAIEQKENALLDAREKLADYTIRAPFDGVIAEVNAKLWSDLASGATVATLITEQRIAEISLNEVDVAKVNIGQKVNLTFDAIEDLNITGKVAEVDIIGTISQGVVTYNVKVIFDTQDERIKPGMSVTADIITDAKTDVLVLPNSAIKSQAGSYYVELVEIPEEKKEEFLNNKVGVILPNLPKKQLIEVGLSNNTLTEILSGLKEGDIVISSTITSTTQTAQTQRTQRFQIPGMGGMGVPR
jgi:multidrug efflux pump subunit AcrA (membrane-fusion protein)